MQPERTLAGLRVLVAENRFLVASNMERILVERGCAVLGPVPSVEHALARIDLGAPDAAVLNPKLGGQSAAPVAAALRARGVPFVVVTGYAEPPDPCLRDAPRVEKPFRDEELARAVALAVRARVEAPAS